MSLVTVSTERRRASRNSGQFTPTVLVTEAVRDEGYQGLRKGQWVIDGSTGRRGQFYGTKRSLLGRTKAQVREYKAGQPFSAFQQKYA